MSSVMAIGTTVTIETDERTLAIVVTTETATSEPSTTHRRATVTSACQAVLGPDACCSRQRSPPPKPRGAPAAEPNNCVGIFGLSIRTQEEDLKDLFGKAGRVDNVVIVYDQRSARSRGFGFITMDTIESAQRAIDQISGMVRRCSLVRSDARRTCTADESASTSPARLAHTTRRQESIEVVARRTTAVRRQPWSRS